LAKDLTSKNRKWVFHIKLFRKKADRLAKVLTPEKNHVTSNLIKEKDQTPSMLK